MAPGVGKTYRMLEEGHRRTARGTDLVVGFVEAHGRPETEKLLDGLEIIPRRRVEYRGVVVEEMDTDAILARAPDGRPRRRAGPHERARLGARRSAGRTSTSCSTRASTSSAPATSSISSSVADAVATITGAPVNERIPDEVLAAADEVELVDMSPYALRQRMRHGNVYSEERARIALDRFFTESNLTALRELSLRFVAGRVDAQLEGAGPSRTIQSVSERVLVLLDDAPATPRALRRAAATAAVLRAPLLAVVVATPADESASSERMRRIRELLDDATDLGAEILMVESADVAEGVATIARARRVTRLIIAHRTSTALERVRKSPLADRILALLPTLEITIVADAREATDAFQVGRGD